MKIKYEIFNPAGNITALVMGDNYSFSERKLINNIIMKKEPKVEQVGFLSDKKMKLTMAGGEFCGNATRCAASYYIKKQKDITLEISNKIIKAGADENNEIWCEIPIEGYKIRELQSNIYEVKLNGITIIVVKDIKNYKFSKKGAKKIIKDYSIDDSAVGVMFIEKNNKNIKIYPIVWVKEIDTLFFENACGSGTIAVSMLESILTHESNRYLIEQPSGAFLETRIILKNNKIIKAILKGKIERDYIIKEITYR